MKIKNKISSLLLKSGKKIQLFGTKISQDNTNKKPLYVVSLHKSGTHLLKNILESLGKTRYAPTGKLSLHHAKECGKDSYIISHFLPHDDVLCACANGNAKIIFNIRDPRDIFLSNIDYFDHTRPDTAFEHVNFYRNAYRNAFKNRYELAIAILKNRTLGEYPYTLESQFESCLILNYHPSVLKVKYERLLPSSDTSLSQECLSEIYNYMDIPVPKNLEEITLNAYQKKSRTYNVAKSQRWRTDLDPELLNLFMSKYGHIVEAFGYPIK